MSSTEEPEGSGDHFDEAPQRPSESIERQLFESLVHHLIEKGVLTRNDALSVVQTVAEVKLAEREGKRPRDRSVELDLVILERLYASFELVSEQPVAARILEGGNVLRLRPPLHGDNPKFPKDD